MTPTTRIPVTRKMDTLPLWTAEQAAKYDALTLDYSERQEAKREGRTPDPAKIMQPPLASVVLC